MNTFTLVQSTQEYLSFKGIPVALHSLVTVMPACGLTLDLVVLVMLSTMLSTMLSKYYA